MGGGIPGVAGQSRASVAERARLRRRHPSRIRGSSTHAMESRACAASGRRAKKPRPGATVSLAPSGDPVRIITTDHPAARPVEDII